MLLMISFLSSILELDQESKADFAAFAALSTSSAFPKLMVAKAFSVAGLITSSVDLPVGSIHLPLIKNLL